jgi:hypothetical protein
LGHRPRLQQGSPHMSSKGHREPLSVIRDVACQGTWGKENGTDTRAPLHKGHRSVEHGRGRGCLRTPPRGVAALCGTPIHWLSGITAPVSLVLTRTTHAADKGTLVTMVSQAGLFLGTFHPHKKLTTIEKGLLNR